MKKYLSYNFHIWKNGYHRYFIHFYVRLELYGKKFFKYGKGMRRSFGEPGKTLVSIEKCIDILIHVDKCLFPLIFVQPCRTENVNCILRIDFKCGSVQQ